MNEIIMISYSELYSYFLNAKSPYMIGKYLAFDSQMFIALISSENNFKTKSFKYKKAAINWLRNN